MKKNILTLLLLLTFSTVWAKEKSPFTMNGWQFHEYNIPKLEEAINKAPEYGINFVIFSHGLYRHTEAFLAGDENFDEQQAMTDPFMSRFFKTADSNHSKPSKFFQHDIQRLGALCEKKGINYYVWSHELDDIPARYLKKGKVDMDNPELYDFLAERYTKLFTVLPHAAGMVLTFHETEFKMFRDEDVISDLSVSERIYKVTKLLYDILTKQHKTLIIRNFFYERDEIEAFTNALQRLPDDIIVMNKPTPHEFHPFYPPDTNHGNVGNKRQIIEIDLGVEKAYDRQGIYAQTEDIQRYARRAQEKGLTGMVGRCRLFYDKPFEDSHEVNLYAFSRFLQNPSLSTEQVLLDWAAKRYPYAPEAAQYLAAAFGRTQFINHNGRYFLKWWLTKSIGAEWDDYRYYFGHIHSRTTFKWSEDPADELLEYKLYYPDPETYDKLIEEKDEVIRQIHLAEKEVIKAKRWLRPEDAIPIEEGFLFLLDASILQKEWTRAFFSMRLYMQNPDEKYAIIVRDALSEMQAQERIPGIIYGLDPVTGRRYNIDKFVLEMQWRMSNRERAKTEDKQLLENMGYIPPKLK